jgi:hypothetical protein
MRLVETTAVVLGRMYTSETTEQSLALRGNRLPQGRLRFGSPRAPCPIQWRVLPLTIPDHRIGTVCQQIAHHVTAVGSNRTVKCRLPSEFSTCPTERTATPVTPPFNS